MNKIDLKFSWKYKIRKKFDAREYGERFIKNTTQQEKYLYQNWGYKKTAYTTLVCKSIFN